MRKTALIVSALFALSSVAADLRIVDAGQPHAVIIVADDDPKAFAAAEELRRCIEVMSGARLPLSRESESIAGAPSVRLLIGHTRAAAAHGVAIPSGYDPKVRPGGYDQEGYILKSVGQDIIIAGNSDGHYDGSYYGVNAFLETLGCRWYFPGAWGEVLPRRQTIDVGPLDRLSRPDFQERRLWLSGWVPATPEERILFRDWGRRFGITPQLAYPTVGDGFLATLVDPNVYYETHPEFFAMNKAGARELHHHGDTGRYYDRHVMLCLSNPAVLTESIRNLRRAFAGELQMDIVSPNGVGISPPDGVPFCYCETCLATNQNFRYPYMVHERMQSDEFFRFANDLAAAFPDKYISTFAYSLREVPPQGVKLGDNVAVTVAPISCCVLHTNADPRCWRRRQFMSMLREWTERSRHVTLYFWNPGMLLGLFVPERLTANLAVDMPIYHQLGVKGFNCEGRKAFMQTWLSYYIQAKLMWDADADVDALKKDFYQTFFGPAAVAVQAWWDAHDAALQDAAVHVHEDWLVNHVYSVDYVRGIQPHIDAAKAAALEEPYASRVAAVALIAEHLAAYADMEAADREMDYARAAQAGHRMWEIKKALHAIYPMFITPEDETNPTYFFSKARSHSYAALHAKTAGERGSLVAALPAQMRFRRDAFNEGVHYRWYLPQTEVGDWSTRDTFLTWDQQEEPLSADGHDYDGYGWYRGEIEIPAEAVGKPLTFYCGGVINEAWVWLNGEYVGHKPHALWWAGNEHAFELDLTQAAKAGTNTLVIRVWNDAEIGGLYRRGFIYAPKATR